MSSNKIQKPGQLPTSTKKERETPRQKPHRSPGWIKARQERTARRAEGAAGQQRKAGHLFQAEQEQRKKDKVKATNEAVTKRIKEAEAAKKAPKWEKPLGNLFEVQEPG